MQQCRKGGDGTRLSDHLLGRDTDSLPGWRGKSGGWRRKRRRRRRRRRRATGSINFGRSFGSFGQKQLTVGMA